MEILLNLVLLLSITIFIILVYKIWKLTIGFKQMKIKEVIVDIRNNNYVYTENRIAQSDYKGIVS